MNERCFLFSICLFFIFSILVFPINLAMGGGVTSTVAKCCGQGMAFTEAVKFAEVEVILDSESTFSDVMSLPRAPGSEVEILEGPDRIRVQLSAEGVEYLAERGASITVKRKFVLLEGPPEGLGDSGEALDTLSTCSGSFIIAPSYTNVSIPDNTCPTLYAHSDITISGAPSGAVANCIDVHWEVVHSYPSDLVIVVSDYDFDYSYIVQYLEPYTSGTITGITGWGSELVNQTWTLWASDCFAGYVGYIDYWWIKVYYEEVGGYCGASGGCSSAPGSLNIDSVEVGDISNTGTGCSGYTDYTSMSTTMEIGQDYPITVVNGDPYDQDDQCGLWVDWNQDEDFSDAGETIALTGDEDNIIFTGTITPPEGAVLGDTRMRVRIRWAGTLGPCGTTDWGEVEDYTINVTGPASEIHGSKFHDINENGVCDGGEPNLSGWEIYLDLDEDGQYDIGEPNVITGVDGSYQFQDLETGTYIVSEVAQCGWRQTAPLFSGEQELIVVTDARDLVFDCQRNLLYISTASGMVERYDLVSKSLLSPLSVGTSLYGIDITPDCNWLYVTEGQTSGSEGYVHKVNLNTGIVTEVSYTLTTNESGSWDIEIGSDGKGLMTTSFDGSGGTPVRELDTATGVLTIRNDVPGTEPDGKVSMNSSIYRSGDRTLLLITGTSSGGHVYKYDAPADSFPDDIELEVSLSNRPFSIDRNGDLIGFQTWTEPVKVWTDNFFPVLTFNTTMGGLVFDSQRNILFVAEEDLDQVIAFSSKTGVELGRVDVPEDIDYFTTFYEGMMAVSDDGRFLALSTTSGVRLFGIGGVHSVTLADGEDAADDITFGNSPVIAGDFDGDEEVDFNDLEILSQGWLMDDFCIDIAPTGGDGVVNLGDFSALAANWLEGIVFEEYEDFETGDFSRYPWSHSGDAPWTVVSDEFYEGSYCVRSGDIADNQTSVLEVTLDVEAGPVRFNYKRSSETGGDILVFYVDGDWIVSGWSGDIDWRRYTHFVSAGVHTFRWEYQKDGSDSDYSDCCWLDGIQFPPIN